MSSSNDLNTTPGGAPDLRRPEIQDSLRRYWRTNVRIMIALLVVWAVVGLVVSVLLADRLNAIYVGGFPLGFWFAQQGSIIIFVLLILIYAVMLNRLDRRHHAEIMQLISQQERP